jgi:hypothetical protein
VPGSLCNDELKTIIAVQYNKNVISAGERLNHFFYALVTAIALFYFIQNEWSLTLSAGWARSCHEDITFLRLAVAVVVVCGIQ